MTWLVWALFIVSVLLWVSVPVDAGTLLSSLGYGLAIGLAATYGVRRVWVRL